MARQSPADKSKSRKPLQKVAETTEKGGLHRSLGIPMGKKIGAERIEQSTHSRNPKIRKEANLAQTYAKYRGG